MFLSSDHPENMGLALLIILVASLVNFAVQLLPCIKNNSQLIFQSWIIIDIILIAAMIPLSGGLQSRAVYVFIPILLLSGTFFSIPQSFCLTTGVSILYTLEICFLKGISAAQVMQHITNIIPLFFISNLIAAYTFAEVRQESFKRESFENLSQELSTKIIHLKAVNRMGEATNSLDSGELINTALEVIQEFFRSECTFIMLVDENHKSLKLCSQRGFNPPLDFYSTNLAQGILSRAMSQNQVIQFELRHDEDLNLILNQYNLACGLIIPVKVVDQLLGVFGIFSNTPFQQDESILFSILIGRLSVALYNAHLYKQSQEHARKFYNLFQNLTDLMEVADAVQGSLKQEDILQTISQKCYRRFSAHTCQINLINQEENWLEISAFQGFQPRLTGRIHKNIYRYSSQCPVLMGDKARIYSSANACPYFHSRDLVKTYMCAPLRVFGETFGVIHLTSLEEKAFSEQDLVLLSSFAQEAGLAVQRGRLYEQLALEKEKAEQANLLKTEFLATISHELRTPLNSIIGYTQCLLDGVDGILNPEQEEDLQKVLNNAENLLRLINNILDLSRLELDPDELCYEKIDVCRLINDAVKTIRPLADAHNLEIHLNICEFSNPIQSDGFRLQQILNNLLSNAVKFTQQGKITISTDLDTSPGFLTFTIADTGVGFPREAQDYIFDRFRQADGSITRRFGGSGLGLSICKNLVELMGGKIWAESIINQGSRFYFTIPLTRPASEP